MSVEKSSLIHWVKNAVKDQACPQALLLAGVQCACVEFLACCTRETGFHFLTIKLRAPCLSRFIMDESHNILVFVLWDHIGWVANGLCVET